jgi:hypothetical protein
VTSVREVGIADYKTLEWQSIAGELIDAFD